jgi:hypothetical protein
MSLFENPEYHWRETFFVLFDESRRPPAEEIKSALECLGGNLEVTDLRADENGRIESLTIYAPDDFAAMDVSCTTGDEVAEQVPELLKEVEPNIETDEEKSKFRQLTECTARLDVFHFQHQSNDAGEEPSEEFMDPGGLLVVLERLGEICNGVVVDPQSGGLM